jgi:hypothetical protein
VIQANLERDYRSVTEQSIPNIKAKQALARTSAAPRHRPAGFQVFTAVTSLPTPSQTVPLLT